MQTFLDLLREGVIFQGLITVIILITDGVLMVKGQTLPDFMMQLTILIIGFYFGAKVEQRATAIARENNK
jgi:hypothetical protein